MMGETRYIEEGEKRVVSVEKKCAGLSAAGLKERGFGWARRKRCINLRDILSVMCM